MKDLKQDKELIEKCLQGCNDAWQRFIKQYSSLVYYVIQKVLRSKDASFASEDIDDLHNDIFLSIMDHDGRKLRQYEGKNGCSVSTWIRIIAVRSAIDFLRKRKETVSLSEETAGPATDLKNSDFYNLEKILQTEEQKAVLKDLIDHLAPRDRLFMRLFYYDEIPPKDIARVFNYSTSAVYSRGSYLREKLKKAFAKKRSKKKGLRSSID